MRESVTIPRNPDLQTAEDYATLRQLGIEHLEVLATKIWTDFNIHDPGITSLEALCYAITDLANRVSLPVADLFTSDPDNPPVPENKCFYTAAEILPCSPVTFYDFRKVLIDVPQVKNAWLAKAETCEKQIYINCEEGKLTLDPPPDSEKERLAVKLEGVYDITILPDDDIDINDPAQTGPIIANVKKQYHKFRSLCEDMKPDVKIMQVEEISLCADIEVEPAADIDEVMAEIFFRINSFLDPKVNFYTIEQLLDKGKTIDQIFEGPLLAHGFIDEDELRASQKKTVIYTSDLYNIIMDVPGVVSVNKLIINNFIDGVPQSNGESWCLKLTDPECRVPRLVFDRLKVTFFKGLLPFIPSQESVEGFLQILEASDRFAKLSYFDRDLPVPEGTYYEVGEYYPITNQFPEVYGVGPVGLKAGASGTRKAQAKQFKAYLLFFEQIMANYLAQLAHVKDLFCWNDSETNFVPSYYTQRVEGIREIAELYFPDYDNEATFQVLLQLIVESEETRIERRNRFLEHLIAMFAEQMVEYSLIRFSGGGLAAKEELINDKARFLSEYPLLSRDRGKGFDMIKLLNTSPPTYDLWDSENITGLMRRVGRLLGIDNVERRTLSMGCLDTFAIIEDSGKWHYEFTYQVEIDGIPVIITMTGPEACSKGEAEDQMELTISKGKESTNYTTNASPINFEIRDFQRPGPSAEAILKIGADPSGPGTIELSVDQGGGSIVVIGSYSYDVPETAEEIVDALIESISVDNHASTGYCAKDGSAVDELIIIAPEGSDAEGNTYMLSFSDTGDASPSILQQFMGGEDGMVIGTSNTFTTAGERDEAIEKSITFFAACDEEGLHIVEHILLRPKKEGDALLNACIHCPPGKSSEEKTCGVYFTAVPTTSSGNYFFRFEDQAGASILKSRISGFSSAAERNKVMFQVYEFGASFQYFEIVQSASLKYYFRLYDNESNIIATSTNTNYATFEAAGEVVEKLVAFFDALRNPSKEVEDTPAESDPCLYENDPYSFRITVVLPGYTERFRDINFRAFADKVIREETPAHIVPKICWINREQMKDFEEAYETWLFANAEHLDPDLDPPIDAPDLAPLISQLDSLSNYYPIRAKLHDCEQGNDESAIILNQSNLGNA